MQIGAEERCLCRRRLVPTLGVSVQHVIDKTVEHVERRLPPAAEPFDGFDGPVEVERIQHGGRVRQVEIAADCQTVGIRFRFGFVQRHEVFVPHPVYTRADRAGRVFRFVGGNVDRHHDLGLDLHDRAGSGVRQRLTPFPLGGHIAAVADHGGGIRRQIERHVARHAAADREGDAAGFQLRRTIGEAVDHEGVVPGIGFRVTVHQAETDKDGQAVFVGAADRHFERRIAAGTLGLLHPVQHVGAVGAAFAFVQVPDAGVLNHGRYSGCDTRRRAMRISPP